jgi:hypothetical protein
MKVRYAASAVLLLIISTGTVAAQAGTGCWVRGDRADLELRASPFDSASVLLEAGMVKVCYSRPRKLGRPIMGRLVPYGVPWRMGADEATSIHLPVAGSVAGVELQPGWYSLYAVPGQHEWQIVVNREARRWGTPIDGAVLAGDIARAAVPAHTTDASEDLLRMNCERSAGNATELIVHWDRTAVHIPVVLYPGS